AAPSGPPPGAPPPGASSLGSGPPGPPSMPPGGFGIQGPVASGPVASGPTSSTPFAVAQPPPAGADDDRAQSWRVYAIVLGLSGLAFATMVLAVVAVLVMPGMLEGDAPSE